MSIDLSKTIEAKSDQLNADDLLGGPKVIIITAVKAGSPDQPVIISYEGDNGKPWKPSKGMRRVLCAAWGVDGSEYIGRSVELYNEASVKWGGQDVGGIKISKLSNLKNPVVIPLTLSRGKKVPITIRPLEPKAKKEMTMEERQTKTIGMLEKAGFDVSEEMKQTFSECSTPEELKALYEAITKEKKDA